MVSKTIFQKMLDIEDKLSVIEDFIKRDGISKD